MLGIQAFNREDNFKIWKDETVEYNFNWLTKGLGIAPEDITFVEDVWAGGGNLGPSIEYFVKGMEIGNMVFMQYKTFHDGSLEELAIKVIDTGIGLERIPWLLNGTPTSYSDIFPTAYKYLSEKLGITMDNAIWEKLGPLSSRLDIDECVDIEKTWLAIANIIGEPLEAIKKSIEPLRDIFIILDHTRTLLMTITDGALPSNVGGGGNLRNILRRTFAIMKKNDWWSKITFDEYIEIFEKHKQDLEKLYGKFSPYSSFKKIIEIEHDRWKNTEDQQRVKLEKLLKKKKDGLSIDDWIIAMTSWGIPADLIASISKTEIPNNLYYEISTRAEKVVKATEQILYNTTHLPGTKNLYYDDHHMYSFNASIVEIFANLKQNNRRNIIILDQSAFYPTSGGQINDVGKLTIDGVTYDVIDVEKVGHCVLHIISKDLPIADDNHYIGMPIVAEIDRNRRSILRNHHTATHIVYASARQVLGPHVWQQGAKKTLKQAHLDITHYNSLEKSEILRIQDHANKIIMGGSNIIKSMMDKAEAEQKYGFSLYQGGVVPGNELRIVNIDGIDVEACCGTHCDKTSEVGWVKILTSKKVADGIVRLYFVAGEKTIEKLNQETTIISDLTKMWSNIALDQLVPTAERIFKERKKFEDEVKDGIKSTIGLQVRYLCDVEKYTKVVIFSKEESPTIYFSYLAPHAKSIKESKKGIVYVGNNFIYGIVADANMVDLSKLELHLKEGGNEDAKFKTSNKLGSKKEQVDGILQFSSTVKAKIERNSIEGLLKEIGYQVLDF